MFTFDQIMATIIEKAQTTKHNVWYLIGAATEDEKSILLQGNIYYALKILSENHQDYFYRDIYMRKYAGNKASNIITLINLIYSECVADKSIEELNHPLFHSPLFDSIKEKSTNEDKDEDENKISLEKIVDYIICHTDTRSDEYYKVKYIDETTILKGNHYYALEMFYWNVRDEFINIFKEVSKMEISSIYGFVAELYDECVNKKFITETTQPKDKGKQKEIQSQQSQQSTQLTCKYIMKHGGRQGEECGNPVNLEFCAGCLKKKTVIKELKERTKPKEEKMCNCGAKAYFGKYCGKCVKNKEDEEDEDDNGKLDNICIFQFTRGAKKGERCTEPKFQGRDYCKNCCKRMKILL